MKKNRILALLLAAAMVVTYMPAMAFAASWSEWSYTATTDNVITATKTYTDTTTTTYQYTETLKAPDADYTGSAYNAADVSFKWTQNSLSDSDHVTLHKDDIKYYEFAGYSISLHKGDAAVGSDTSVAPTEAGHYYAVVEISGVYAVDDFWINGNCTVEYVTKTEGVASASSISPVTVAAGSKLDKPSNPIADGYEFVGWYTKDQNNFDFKNEVIATNTTLFAHWTPVNDCKVTFKNTVYTGSTYTDLNVITMDSKTVTYGGKVSKPDDPTMPGYTFVGWSNASKTNVFDFNETITEDTTIYAVWAKNPTVSFDTNGGSEVDSITLTSGSKLDASSIQTTTKSGYAFVGWFETKASATNADASETFNFNKTITTNTTLYAGWTDDNTSEVTFDTNGGSAVNSMTVAYNGKIDERKIGKTTKTGYKFVGWFATETDLDVDDADASKKFNFNTAISTNTTLYAGWTLANDSTVSFYVDGDLYGQSQTVAYEGKATKPADPTKKGYAFKGWYASGSNVAYDFNAAVTTDTNLYASWTDVKYTINLDGNGYKLPASGTNAAYAKSMITYDVAEGDTLNDYVENYDTLKTWCETLNPGYTFEGLYTDQACTNKFTAYADKVNSNLYLYAKFTQKTCKVSFTVNGGSHLNSIDVKYGDKLAETDVPATTRANWNFMGWYTDASCTNLYDFNKAVTTDTNLYADWSQDHYKVNVVGGSFKVTNGTNTNVMTIILDQGEDLSYYLENATALKAKYEEYNPGYNFLGLYSDSAMTKPFLDYDSAVTSNMNLYAKFTAKTYTVKYNANNASVKEKMNDVENQAYDVKTTLATNKFTRTGYKFVGWSTHNDSVNAEISDYDTTKYTVAELIAKLNKHTSASQNTAAETAVDSITLYAVWAPVHCVVVYDGNGADYDNYATDTKVQALQYDDDTAATSDKSNTLRAVQFEKTGYKFTGWNTKADGTGTAYTDQQVLGQKYIEGYELDNTNMSSEDNARATLYAQWTPCTYQVLYYNGTTASPTDQTMTYDKKAALKANIYTKAGYYFKGWSTSASSTNVVFYDGQEVKNIGTGDWCACGNPKHAETKGVKLYAVWAKDNTVLTAKVTSNTKNATVTWNAVSGAASYDVKVCKCGTADYYKAGTTLGTSINVTKCGKKAFKKNANYTFVVTAKDAAGNVIATSVKMHTIMGKVNGAKKQYGNVQSVTATTNKVMTKGTTFKISASMKVYKGKKCLNVNHCAKFRYRTSDATVATVSTSGVVTAKGAGTCYIYTMGVNGAWTKTRIDVPGAYTMVADK